MRETARREVDRIRWSPPESSMGLDQSSRAVELKPLKEKRKGFRHTLAIQKAGRTDPDEMRVYRWLKAYIKHNTRTARPRPREARWRRRRPHCPASVERRDGAAPPHTPHPRRARAQPARPLSVTVRAPGAPVKITSMITSTTACNLPRRTADAASRVVCLHGELPPGLLYYYIIRRLRTLYSKPLHVP